MEEVPRRTSLVPLAFPCFVLRLIGLETKNVLDYQGRAGDHVHCTVEPSPGHIRCREKGPKIVDFNYFFLIFRSDLFRNVLGVRGRGVPGPKLRSGDFLETFSGFLGSGLCVDGRGDPNVGPPLKFGVTYTPPPKA